MTLATLLAAVARRLPCRPVGTPEDRYLSRYRLLTTPWFKVDLNFFHRGDRDKALHSHPFYGLSLILVGGYREERREALPGRAPIMNRVRVSEYAPGSVSLIRPSTFHRVDLLAPTGCWTLFVSSRGNGEWGFWDRHSDAYVPIAKRMGSS